MSERRRISEPDDVKVLSRYRAELKIDRDALDDCVINQPELYYHVAAAHALATAERDAIKLDLEQEEAAESASIRRAAAQIEEKLTEANLREKLKMSAPVQKLERALVAAKADVEAWSALRDAYQQRSYMLRELVAMHLSRMAGTSMGGARGDLADARHAAAGELRTSRRG